MILQRSGYGSAFNTITIDNGHITKQAKGEYGIYKLKKEQKFYQYLIDNNIPFNVPKLINITENSLTLQYIKGATPLYLKYNSSYLSRVYEELTKLHNSGRKWILKTTFFNDLKIEMYDKIVERNSKFNNTDNNISSESQISIISNIMSVNGVKLLKFDTLLNILYDKVKEYFSNLYSNVEINEDINLSNLSPTHNVNLIYYYPIHGDCQFNNILVTENDELIFIDPRGYYGSSSIYGLKEYDYAKVKFALTGYDLFDNTNEYELNIKDNDLKIDIKFLESDIISDEIISYITILIWMGNAHCFINNPTKMWISYYYALYLGSKLFSS